MKGRRREAEGGGPSSFHPPLMSAGDSHIFTVLGDCPTRDVDTLLAQFRRELLVRHRLDRVLLFDHFLDQPLEIDERCGTP